MPASMKKAAITGLEPYAAFQELFNKMNIGAAIVKTPFKSG